MIKAVLINTFLTDIPQLQDAEQSAVHSSLQHLQSPASGNNSSPAVKVQLLTAIRFTKI